MRILFLINNPDFFLSHRLPPALAAAKEGHEIHVAAPHGPGEEKMRGHGFRFHPIRMTRSGMAPWNEFITFISILRLYRHLRPDLTHQVTIKPVLYGTLAARWSRIPAVCNAISGLGFVFLARGIQAAVVRALVLVAYRFCLRHPNMKVILQNESDRNFFLDRGVLRADQCVLIPGSGADLRRFVPAPEASGIPVVLLASRLLWDKGVAEFVEAARILNAKSARARFVLVGSPDPGNPASIPDSALRAWAEEKIVELWGFRSDMEQVFRKAHIVCLPSYREGFPKVMVEAAAAGKPLVVSDVPGCREVVVPDRNGYRVPVRNPQALADAIENLIGDPGRRAVMGRASRELAVTRWSQEKVVEMTLETYRALLPGKDS